eukprot:1159180-Pelagomonas_calceolata.AAC.5
MQLAIAASEETCASSGGCDVAGSCMQLDGGARGHCRPACEGGFIYLPVGEFARRPACQRGGCMRLNRVVHAREGGNGCWKHKVQRCFPSHIKGEMEVL